MRMWYWSQLNDAPFVYIVVRSCSCAIAAACIGLFYAVAAGLGLRHVAAAAGLGLRHTVAGGGLGLRHVAAGGGLGLCHAAAAATAATTGFSERNSCLFCWFGCISLRGRWSFL